MHQAFWMESPEKSRLFSPCFVKSWGAAFLLSWLLVLQEGSIQAGWRAIWGQSESFLVSEGPASFCGKKKRTKTTASREEEKASRSMVYYKISLCLSKLTCHPSLHRKRDKHYLDCRWKAFPSKCLKILENLHCLFQVAWWKRLLFFSF